MNSTSEKGHRSAHIRKGSPVPTGLRERAQRAIDTYGHMAVMRAVGLSQSCFWRAVGGGPVHAGTVLQLESALDAMDHP